MTERERELLEKVFNPYGEEVNQGELTDVDADWELVLEELEGR